MQLDALRTVNETNRGPLIAVRCVRIHYLNKAKSRHLQRILFLELFIKTPLESDH